MNWEPRGTQIFSPQHCASQNASENHGAGHHVATFVVHQTASEARSKKQDDLNNHLKHPEEPN